MNAPKILIAVDSINVNDSSGSRVNVALIQNLIDCGYKLTVIHSSYQEVAITGAETVNLPEQKTDLNYWLSRAQRVTQRLTNWKIHKIQESIFGFSFTFFNDVNRFKSALVKQSLDEFDLIITLSKGGSFRPHAALLDFPKHHHKWLAYVHDPFPMHLYPHPYEWIEPGHKLKERLMKRISECAAFSGFPSLLLQERMEQFFPNFKKTAVLIPHQSEKNQNFATSLPSYFNPAHFNLLHAGSLMKPRDPIGLINGFKEFLKNCPQAKPNARLYLIGPASYHRQNILKAISDVPEILFMPNGEPYLQMLGIQNAADVNIILEADAPDSPFLPAKVVNCVAARKPILHLGPKCSETMRLLGENYPYHATIFDSERISKLIERLFHEHQSNNQRPFYDSDALTDYFGAVNLGKAIETLCLKRK